MEQLLDLVLHAPEPVSPREVASRGEGNHAEGDSAVASMTSTLQPVVSTPEHPKNEIPQVVDGIELVVNPVAECCCSPSRLRIAESPKEKQPLSQGMCGCSSGKA